MNGMRSSGSRVSRPLSCWCRSVLLEACDEQLSWEMHPRSRERISDEWDGPQTDLWTCKTVDQKRPSLINPIYVHYLTIGFLFIVHLYTSISAINNKSEFFIKCLQMCSQIFLLNAFSLSVYLFIYFLESTHSTSYCERKIRFDNPFGVTQFLSVMSGVAFF